jgi:aspartyl-tRNA(Asn)/glutamyl-tRNA(Gln) amidotransferase subunit C
MQIDRQTVEHVALLARLDLSAEEVERFTQDLQAILDHIDQLQELNTDDLLPMEHAGSSVDVFREDRARPSLPPEVAVSQSADEDGEFFRVPQVVE